METDDPCLESCCPWCKCGHSLDAGLREGAAVQVGGYGGVVAQGAAHIGVSVLSIGFVEAAWTICSMPGPTSDARAQSDSPFACLFVTLLLLETFHCVAVRSS